MFNVIVLIYYGLILLQSLKKLLLFSKDAITWSIVNMNNVNNVIKGFICIVHADNIDIMISIIMNNYSANN